MRILLVALLGFVLAACGEKHESVEIHGIMIGDPIENVKDLDSYEKNDWCEITTYYKETIGDFQNITIFEFDGKALGVRVGITKQDVDDVLVKMKDMYGEFNVMDGDRGQTFEFKPHGILYKIAVNNDPKMEDVVYATEKLEKNIGRVFERCYD